MLNEQDRISGQEVSPHTKGRSDSRTNSMVMLITFVAGIGLMGLKFLGYWVTGSAAILSDALESIINVVASGFGLWSVVFSARPADESHPYGHGKIEFFSAGFEGALIMAASVGIFYEGLKQFLDPQQLPNLGEGLLFLILAGLGNLILGTILLRVGKRTKSMVLEADGKHLLTDVFTSGAVLVGLALVYFTGWFRFDGIIACIAGVNIVFWGVNLVRQALAGLLNTSDPELLDEICDLLVLQRKDSWVGVHRLRAWKSGSKVHVDFHLVLQRELSLEAAHREVKELEQMFSDHFGGMSEVLVHLDPCSDPECPVCNYDPCKVRQGMKIGPEKWSRQSMTTEVPSRDWKNVQDMV